MPKRNPSQAVADAARELSEACAGLRFAEPTAYVYNPLDYAWAAHDLYIQKFANTEKRAVLLGMNPGPWGMAQTGVPFGEIPAVRGWMGIEAEVAKPRPEHPKRPVEGFGCTRSEVSGRRLWGLFAERFGSPEAFFADHYVANYCPLVFMEESGKNRTPDKLPAAERAALDAACDAHLVKLLEALRPEWVIGVGAYAETKLKEALPALGFTPTVGKVLHPSPASPAANRGWAEAATKQLVGQGVW